MKKQYLFFLVFVIHFSFCYSQNNIAGYNDTIFKDRGNREIACKIVHADKYYVYYKTAKDTAKTRKMELWRIRYVHYGSPQVKALIPKPTVQTWVTNEPDTTPQLLFGQVNIAYGFSAGDLPFIANGGHLDLTGQYFFTREVAVTIRTGIDVMLTQDFNNYIQDTYTIQQYMAGLTLRLGNNTKLSARNPVPGPPWIDFIGLGGLVIGQNPKFYGYVQNSTGIIATGSINAGTGYGFGGYAGFQISSVTKKQKVFSIGLGYLFTTLRYNDYTYNLVGAPGSTISGKSYSILQPSKFYLGIVQAYIGIGF